MIETSTLAKKTDRHYGHGVCGIYLITNKINNKVYVGQSHNIGKRIIQHKINANLADKRGDTYLCHAIKKYGFENFIFEIIYVCDNNIDQKELNDIEVSFINKYRSSDSLYGYNLTTGGEGGLPNKEARQKHKKAMNDPALRKKMSENRKIWWASHSEIRERLIDSRRNKIKIVKSKPVKIKIDRSRSIVCIEKQCTFDSLTDAAQFANTRPSTVYSNCEGRNIKAGLYHFSWPNSDGVYAIRGKKKHPEASEEYKLQCINRSILNGEAKAVKCIETGKVYASCSMAAIELGLKLKAIRSHLHDIKRQPRVGGLHFVWYTE